MRPKWQVPQHRGGARLKSKKRSHKPKPVLDIVITDDCVSRLKKHGPETLQTNIGLVRITWSKELGATEPRRILETLGAGRGCYLREVCA